jgi:4-amino-4-deoxy-L-arabinose transferase-like glycosyltransferase
MSSSWETHAAGAPAASTAPAGRTPRSRGSTAGSDWPSRALARVVAARRPRPELAALIVLAGALNLWALSRNGWANDYYSAAARSMSSSWHNFLFASLDRAGVMTVDKPPLALWVQSLSVRAFGYHPLSVLVPQALMGVASVVLVYDLVRRRFGRLGGLVAGLALAVTPIAVAVSRHNNPDALLALCCIAAVWFAVRALEDGRTRWLVLSGVSVGLAFETKMLVALVVVPGIAVAWLLIAPRGRGRLHALGQLLAGGAAMLVVGGAWPALVELTPPSARPWVAGTSDNSVLSLIFGYNGAGRVEGQTGGPGGLGGNMFGSTPGPFRLLNSALGGQAGWLLGFAAVSGLGILLAARARRSDPRTGWLLVVGGAFITTAVLFSAASGIFHPYYVSLLAPFGAALTGAGAAELAGGRLNARIVGPLAIVAGITTELVVLGQYPGQLSWLPWVLIPVGAFAALALLARSAPRVRLGAVVAVIAGLLLAPAVWAVDTLGYATSGTFPAGGPASVQTAGGGGPFGRLGGFGGRTSAGRPGAGAAGLGGVPLFGEGGASRSGSNSGVAPVGAPPGVPGGAAPLAFGRGGVGRGQFGGGPFGGDRSLTQALAYTKHHGGGTIAVSSQSSAAPAIIAQNADVAGIGGFSGRESDVSVSWLAQEVRSGKIRWVLAEQGGAAGGGPRLPGDTRVGSKAAMAAVVKACRRVTPPTSTVEAGATGTIGSSGTSGAFATGGTAAASTLNDCQGRAAAMLSAGA